MTRKHDDRQMLLPCMPDYDPVTRCRRTDPETSRIAAESIEPGFNALQIAVMVAFEEAGPAGMTDKELSRRFRNHGSTYRTRRSELTAKGIIVDTGRRKRHDRSHRLHIVWALARFLPAEEAA